MKEGQWTLEAAQPTEPARDHLGETLPSSYCRWSGNNAQALMRNESGDLIWTNVAEARVPLPNETVMFKAMQVGTRYTWAASRVEAATEAMAELKVVPIISDVPREQWTLFDKEDVYQAVNS